MVEPRNAEIIHATDLQEIMYNLYHNKWDDFNLANDVP